MFHFSLAAGGGLGCGEGGLDADECAKSDHLKNLAPGVEAGFWKVGGMCISLSLC